MKKNTYKIKTDPEDGRQYFEQEIDEADKNHSFYIPTKPTKAKLMRFQASQNIFFENNNCVLS